MDFMFWTCDGCRRMFPASHKQTEVKVQQRSERIYGTDIMHRPVDTLAVCQSCYRTWMGEKK